MLGGDFYIESIDKDTLKALKQCIVGLKTSEITTEYVTDETTGKLKISKQKKVEKMIPPNSDLIKMVYQKLNETQAENYNEFSDEDLEKEKQRLLKELKEKESADRKAKK